MNIKDATELLKVIADESRLRIIKALSKEKKICGNDLLVKVDCKQATLSHHMSVLTDAGLVKAKRNGNKVFYSLITSELETLATFIAGSKVETKVIEVTKVEEVKPANKPVEQPKQDPIQEAKFIIIQPAQKTEKPKGNPVNISVPIYLL